MNLLSLTGQLCCRGQAGSSPCLGPRWADWNLHVPKMVTAPLAALEMINAQPWLMNVVPHLMYHPCSAYTASGLHLPADRSAFQ